MTDFFNAVKTVYKENSYFINIVLGIIIFLLFLLFRKILSNGILSLISKIAYKEDKKRESLTEALMKPLSTFFMLLGLFISLHLNIRSVAIIKGFKILTILIICWGLTNFVSGNLSSVLRINSDKDEKINLTAVKFVSNIFRILIIALAVVMVISELGYNINGLITGLGVGGLAVSLAAQDAVSNLISGFIIVFDKPFKVGEFIQNKDISGTVLEVSMRTTKIRTVDDSVVTVPNSKLTGDAIINISRKNMRLIETEFGLIYSTDKELIEKCKSDIKSYLISNEDIVNSPIRVELEKLDDYSLNFGVFCYTNKTDIHEFYHVLNDVNLNIKRIVDENGAEFAFPTNSVYIENK